MIRQHSFAWATLCATLAIFTVACGDDDDSSPSGTAGSAGSSSGTAGTDSSGAGQAGSAGSAQAGSAGTSTAGSGPGGSAGATSTAFACEGDQKVVEGLNTWTVGGKKRIFYAALPQNTSKPMGVAFWYHGYGDTADNWRQFAPDPDTDADFPLAIITPDDTDLFPPQGLDWAIFDGKASDSNIEAALFEAINGCIAKDHSVDASRLYVAGFSAGAILTNLLASRYQGTIAASLAFSGAWFNDKAETDTINTLGIPVTYSWEPLVAPSTGMALITHGGVNDTFSQGGQKIIDFEVCSQKADPFLLGAKRSYITCAHDLGHAPHPDFTAEIAVHYFKDHQAGVTSPYLGGNLPAYFPASCTLKKP